MNSSRSAVTSAPGASRAAVPGVRHPLRDGHRSALSVRRVRAQPRSIRSSSRCCRVLQAVIEFGTEPADVGGIAHQENTVLEKRRPSRALPGRTREPIRGRLQGQIGAQHSTDAFPKFVERERRGFVDAVGGPLNGEHQRMT